jgi:SAM-dependent methyltransferase
LGLTQEAAETAVSRYPDNLNPDLLDRIPLDADTVLDVGCHTGLLGGVYRLRNPRARVFGIDTDASALALAATRLTEVALLDVEAGPPPFAAPDGYDCIIYGDVLEHLRDPWRVLREHVALLSPRGVVLICVPNVSHWSVTRRLIDGSFAYEEQGLLDRTHLRWFTFESMQRALTETGLALCDVRPRIFDREAAERFADVMAPALAACGVDRESYISRAAPMQYVWRARRTPARTFAVRGTMLKPYGGVSDIRVLNPMRALHTDPSVAVQVGEVGEFPPATDQLPAICVLHRPLLVGEPGLAVFRYLLQRGYLIVTEFDDRPDFLPELLDERLLNFRAAHAVQTTTAELAATLSSQNPEIAVFPNGVSQLWPLSNFQSEDHVTLFFGAINRRLDWEQFMPVLNAVAETMGDRLRFSVLHDREFFDALQTLHKSFAPTSDYQTYLTLLGQAEISFMPLRDTPFNRAKSDLKFIEAGAARVAALASPTVYEGSIRDGETGLLFRSPEELHERLTRLVMAPAYARGLAETARVWVAESRMDAYQVRDRVRWYRSLLDRRDELTRALFERMPELAP